MGNVGIKEDLSSHSCDYEDYCLLIRKQTNDTAANNHMAGLSGSELSAYSCVHLKHYGPFTYSGLDRVSDNLRPLVDKNSNTCPQTHELSGQPHNCSVDLTWITGP